jgi:hypothetical protein
MRIARWLVAVVPATALAICILVPFRTKAFTIDDTLFLDQAVAARADFRHPTAVDVVWTTQRQRLSTIMPSGPTMAWILAPAVDDGRVDERTAHTVVLALLLIAIGATVRLSMRLGVPSRRASWAGVLVVAAPAVLGMAGTVMPDIAAMTFGVVGIERAVAWRDDRRIHQLAFAIVALALAGLARLHALGLVAVAAMFVYERRTFRVWLLIAIAPLALVAAVLWWTSDPGGGDVAGSTGHFLTWRSLDRNIPSFGLHWFLVMPLGGPWLFLRGRRLRWRLLAILAPVCAVGMAVAGLGRSAWLAPLAGLGYLVVLDVAELALRARTRDEIALAAWLLVALPVALYLNLAAKYVVISAPAVAIVIARRASTPILYSTCAAGIALGVGILLADARFADVGRRAAAELVAPHVARGERVWFMGHWGFQWYAEHAGGSALTTQTVAARGDVIVGCEVAGVSVPTAPPRDLLATVADDAGGGVIMSADDAVGFYSNMWGFLPWWWSSGPAERCNAWRVR